MNKLVNLLASLLIITGLLGLFLIYGPVFQQEFNYQIKQISPQDYQLVEDPQEAEEKVEKKEKQLAVVSQPKLFIPQSFDFSLLIPKIGVNSQVFRNINSSDEGQYLPVLKKGIAHAQGSSLPSQPGVVFLFAHSTDSFFNIGRYNAQFFLLRKLEINDDAFVFYENKKYHYQIADKKIVEADQIEKIIRELRGNYLVLQTCHPPGTTLKRLLVMAKLI